MNPPRAINPINKKAPPRVFEGRSVLSKTEELGGFFQADGGGVGEDFEIHPTNPQRLGVFFLFSMNLRESFSLGISLCYDPQDAEAFHRFQPR